MKGARGMRKRKEEKSETQNVRKVVRNPYSTLEITSCKEATGKACVMHEYLESEQRELETVAYKYLLLQDTIKLKNLLSCPKV